MIYSLFFEIFDLLISYNTTIFLILYQTLTFLFIIWHQQLSPKIVLQVASIFLEDSMMSSFVRCTETVIRILTGGKFTSDPSKYAAIVNANCFFLAFIKHSKN